MKPPVVGFLQPAQYGVWITDRRGVRSYHALRSSLDSAHVRLEVQRRAIVEHGAGFTFSVRGPL